MKKEPYAIASSMNVKLIVDYINYRLTAATEHDLHSPFLYDFYMQLIQNDYNYYDFDILKEWRGKLLENSNEIEIQDFGAGSKKLSNRRIIKDIVKNSNASKKQAEFFYRLINKFNPQSVIELGTSLGLTTLYLAIPSKKITVYTIEGCKNTHAFANEFFKLVGVKNITSICGVFDDEFPKLINQLGKLDMLYIDGNHTYEATLKYFKLALSKIHSNSILIFDDINWSKGMQRAWKEVCRHPDVKISLDFFHFGMVFFREEHKAKEHYVLKF